jgi:hypothetical protein
VTVRLALAAAVLLLVLLFLLLPRLLPAEGKHTDA